MYIQKKRKFYFLSFDENLYDFPAAFTMKASHTFNEERRSERENDDKDVKQKFMLQKT